MFVQFASIAICQGNSGYMYTIHDKDICIQHQTNEYKIYHNIRIYIYKICRGTLLRMKTFCTTRHALGVNTYITHMYTYALTHTYTYARTHTNTNTNTYTYTRNYACVRARTHTHTHIHTHIHAQNYILVFKDTHFLHILCVYICMYIRIHSLVCVSIYTYICIHAYVIISIFILTQHTSKRRSFTTCGVICPSKNFAANLMPSYVAKYATPSMPQKLKE